MDNKRFSIAKASLSCLGSVLSLAALACLMTTAVVFGLVDPRKNTKRPF